MIYQQNASGDHQYTDELMITFKIKLALFALALVVIFFAFSSIRELLLSFLNVITQK